jgi:SAM-dependent methyltransferase
MPTDRRLAARLQRSSVTRRLIAAAGRRRATRIVRELRPMLDGHRHLLDIGSGPCSVAEALGQAGLRVTPLDVANFSFVDAIDPVIYDGVRMPFADDSFDAALLGAVLHHVSEPQRLVREAGRVAPRVIVVEDEHDGRLHRSIASLIDSLLSLELNLPRHGYRAEWEWRELFFREGLRVCEVRRWRSLGGLFRNVAFTLERSKVGRAATLRVGSGGVRCDWPTGPERHI